MECKWRLLPNCSSTSQIFEGRKKKSFLKISQNILYSDLQKQLSAIKSESTFIIKFFQDKIISAFLSTLIVLLYSLTVNNLLI